MKTCCTCKVEKEPGEFNKNKNTKDGRCAACKVCNREYGIEYRKENKEATKRRNSKYYSRTKETQSKRKRAKYAENADEVKRKARGYYYLNKEAILKRSKEYYGNNKDVINKKSLEYYKEHKDECVASVVNRERERYGSDAEFTITIRLRKRIIGAIKNNVKSASTKELIGCSIPDLLTHLQKTAKQNYPDEAFDINNYSGKDWHIDHVKPCSSFDLTKESEQKDCFNWSNLQMLKAHDNLVKSNKDGC